MRKVVLLPASVGMAAATAWAWDLETAPRGGMTVDADCAHGTVAQARGFEVSSFRIVGRD